MAKTPDTPKSPKSKAPNSKAPNSKASRPDVKPIGPALAELLNPAINRGDAGMGSGTGLQPPPDNSKDRRSGGEAAIHRARASTQSSPPPRAQRVVGRGRGWGAPRAQSPRLPPHPDPPPQGGREKRAKPRRDRHRCSCFRSRRTSPAKALPNRRSRNSRRRTTTPPPPSRRWIRNWRGSSGCRPRRTTTRRWRGRRAARWKASACRPPRRRWKNLIREGRAEFRDEAGGVKLWTPHRPPRPEKSEGGVRFVIKSDYEPKGDQPHRDQGTGRGPRPQRPHASAARRHRLRQDLHHGQGDRGDAAPGDHSGA